MATKISIDENALRNAELLLQAFLSDKVSGGNFRSGSHLNDVVIRAFAYVYALIQSEVNDVRNRQTLNLLSLATDLSSDSVAEDLLSNWFVSRKMGTRSTGFLKVVLGPVAAVPEVVTVPEDTEFVTDTGVVFTPSFTTAGVYLLNNMTVEMDETTGLQVGYSFSIPVICAESGAVGNIDPGRMAGFDAFDSSVLYAESLNGFSTGVSDETTSDMIERAKTAITSRGMLSFRSIDTYLRDTVTDLREVTVVGAGDTEMRRDLVTDIAAGISVHSLGHVDVYAQLPLEIGLEYPSDGTTIEVPARSNNTETLSTFTVTPSEANQFPISRIRSLTEVSGEEAVTYERASYFLMPSGNYSYLDTSTGVYVDSGSTALTVPESSYYVSYPDISMVNTWSGKVTFTVPASDTARSFIITYDGIKSLAAVSAAIEDRDVRSVAADLRAYSFHPVIASIQFKIYLRSDAPGVFPEESAKSTVSDFVNTFPRDRAMTVSDLTQYLLGTHSVYLAGVGVPTSVFYRLQAPNGQEVYYDSFDKITVEDITKQFDTLGAYSEATRVSQGVSDRTVRVITHPDLISFTTVS